ncbi:hypothetical protein BHU61_07465 [Macrococcus epidermidis]|uniref:NTF2 fold immunity protein domain-containing protein n=1 Tax=Macrococcus epidermidis TaxID=1902580 RepID=A0A327ZSF2_9STAP|nr:MULTISPECIES: hypothetical protein [Macrococcus]MCH4985367.1 hypothetical protein [Macrococcus sp. PK]RAK45139.1 hypothetical protein BHU61_07465 [Macrococcus epidermidis]
MNIILKSTFKKYESMSEILVPKLVKILLSLDNLEKEIYERSKIELSEYQDGYGNFKEEYHPKSKALFKELNEKHHEIIKDNVSEKLKSISYGGSYGKPSEYFYIQDDNLDIYFTMRKKDMATIVIYYEYALKKKHKFIFRLIDNKWLIDEKYYGFSDKSWYKNGI